MKKVMMILLALIGMNSTQAFSQSLEDVRNVATRILTRKHQGTVIALNYKVQEEVIDNLVSLGGYLDEPGGVTYYAGSILVSNADSASITWGNNGAIALSTEAARSLAALGQNYLRKSTYLADRSNAENMRFRVTIYCIKVTRGYSATVCGFVPGIVTSSSY
jgi:hypothetical protein